MSGAAQCLINRGGGSFDSACKAEREHGKVPVPVGVPSGTGGWVRGVARAVALAILHGWKRGVDRPTIGRCGEGLYYKTESTNGPHPWRIARGRDAQRTSPWRARSCWGTSGYGHARACEFGPSLDPRLTTGGLSGGPTRGPGQRPCFYSGTVPALSCHTTTPVTNLRVFRDVPLLRRCGVDFHISFPMTIMAKSNSSKPVKTFRLRGVSASHRGWFI